MFINIQPIFFCFIFAIRNKQSTKSAFLYLKVVLMEKKEILKIVIKVLIYALTLIGGYLGVSSLTSCSASHGVVSTGRATIISVDTTFIKHSGFIKSKNYLPYEHE